MQLIGSSYKDISRCTVNKIMQLIGSSYKDISRCTVNKILKAMSIVFVFKKVRILHLKIMYTLYNMINLWILYRQNVVQKRLMST